MEKQEVRKEEKREFKKDHPPRRIENGEGSDTPMNFEGNQRKRQFNKVKYNKKPKNQREKKIPVKSKTEEWNEVNGQKEQRIEKGDSTSEEEEKNQKLQIINELMSEILKKSECKIYQDNIIRVLLTSDDPVIEVTPRRKGTRRILKRQLQINDDLSKNVGVEIRKEAVEDSEKEKILTVEEPKLEGNLKEKRDCMIKNKCPVKNLLTSGAQEEIRRT